MKKSKKNYGYDIDNYGEDDAWVKEELSFVFYKSSSDPYAKRFDEDYFSIRGWQIA